MKKIIITISVFTIVSCNTYKTSYTPTELAIENVENYIEWLNEDLFQGNITQEKYDLMKETYLETLTLLNK
jgi:hypothetical protein